MIKLLSGKRWQLLHRLVYLCAIGGVVHYWWLVKKDLTNPLTFALLLSLLLGIRLIYWLRGLNKFGCEAIKCRVQRGSNQGYTFGKAPQDSNL